MSLDNTIHSHLDKMEELEIQFKSEIDLIIKAINKNDLIKDPSKTLEEVIKTIGDLMEQKYMALAGKEGIAIANVMERFKKQGKDILVDDSKDPKENQGLVYDKDGSKK